MSKKIIYTENEGLSVAVMHPASGIQIEDCVKHVPVGAKYKFIDESAIPSDRTFRDAWEIVVDGTWMVKG